MSDQHEIAAEVQPQQKTVSGNPLRIEFARRGTIAPVFVAGTFTGWQPVELTQTNPKPEETKFIREFQEVKNGEHQYKFKLGTGDLWTTDDNTRTTTDEHGNKNNVVLVKTDKMTTPSPTNMGQPEKTGTERPQTPTAPHEHEPTMTASPMRADLVANPTTPPNQVANTAAEVADTAAKIDQPAASKPTDSRPSEVPRQGGPTATQLEQALARQTLEPPTTPTTRRNDAKQSDESLASPGVPPAPAVTPVATSPPLAPVKSDSPETASTSSVPPVPPMPATPPRGTNFANIPINVKPSMQEVAVAKAFPSTPLPPSTASGNVKADEKTPTLAAKIALPPSPMMQPDPDAKPSQKDANLSEPSQAGEFPTDEFKLVKRPTTFRERSVAVADTILAIPSMIAAFFASLLQAIMDWLEKMVTSRRDTQQEKGQKTE
ncbi:MAG: hypothetical protein Q9159_002514 [Coniocarpon cinnabarinum]